MYARKPSAPDFAHSDLLDLATDMLPARNTPCVSRLSFDLIIRLAAQDQFPTVSLSLRSLWIYFKVLCPLIPF